MKKFTHTHHFPVSPARLMELVDDADYGAFLVANTPNLTVFEELERHWEGNRRVKRFRMRFEVPLPGFIKRVLPSHGEGWIEEESVLVPDEGRIESHARSSASETRRVTTYRAVDGGTERTTEIEMRATLPVVGRALERIMEREYHKQRDAEYELTLRYLRERGEIA